MNAVVPMGEIRLWSFSRYSTRLYVIAILLASSAYANTNCRRAQPEELITWREPTNHTIEWRIDAVCSTFLECFGYQPNGDVVEYVQLCPLDIQLDDTVYIRPAPFGSPYSTKPTNVTLDEWIYCPDRDYPIEQRLFSKNSTDIIRIPFRFLQPGVVYIAELPNGFFSSCRYGLRVAISVKKRDCTRNDDNDDDSDELYSTAIGLCNGHGICATKAGQMTYRCACDTAYGGRYCGEYDACSEGRCEHNGVCVDANEGLDGRNYVCLCANGFKGDNCEWIIGDCSATTCGLGTCVNAMSYDAYKCHCPDMLTGDHCESELDPCASAPCLNGATCEQQFVNYTCRCVAGMTGRHCEINVDNCLSAPCAEGATCLDGIDNFTCLCAEGYTGMLCNAMLNFCHSSPCQNDGVCIPQLNGYRCNCSNGYQGDHCEEWHDGCDDDDNFCKNGGHCLHTPLGGRHCQCSPGWTGKTCDRLDNLCLYFPCRNTSVCVDLSSPLTPGAYECRCPAGFTGVDCNQDLDECVSNPCLHNATCTNLKAAYTCQCTSGYIGDHCEHNIDGCVVANGNAACLNGATCVDLNVEFRYTCLCALGFTGSFCEVNIDECSSSPCLRGGTCQDLVAGYVCVCASGQYGKHCELDVNLCEQKVCGAHGKCHSLARGYVCECDDGWTGELCRQEVDECISEPCFSGATCVDLMASYRCLCPVGFTGMHCEIPADGCSSSPCLNNATCRAGEEPGQFMCDCTVAYTGQFCESLLNWCAEHLYNCSSSGQCVEGSSDYICDCDPGYTGQYCEVNIDECANNPCLNGAICQDLVAAYQCFCNNGFMGVNCSINVDECASNPCLNNATCVDGVASYSCVCTAGFTGESCGTDIDDCVTAVCHNRGTCVDLVNGYRCECPPGFTGETCDEMIDRCQSSPCHSINTIRCESTKNDYNCVCYPGYRGRHCTEESQDDCNGQNLCQNNGSCIVVDSGFRCLCVLGYGGEFCERRLDACLSSPCHAGVCHSDGPSFKCLCPADGRHYDDRCKVIECSNATTCLNGGFCSPVTGWCVCVDGFVGDYCHLVAGFCDYVSCLNNATCVDYEPMGHECVCAAGWFGPNCNTSVGDADPCVSDPCTDGATCVINDSGYVCVTDKDDCEANECAHGATCVDRENSYLCLCTPGYTGIHCEQEVKECGFNPCQHRGYCVYDVVSNSYDCYCRNGYTGKHCEVDHDECASEPCQNQGSCTDLVASYQCKCRPGFTGVTCETNIDDCVDNLCENGATCLDNVAGYVCSCSLGFTGQYCEVELNECDSLPCQRGGVCRDNGATYVCDCPRPFSGINCELLPCDTNPCYGGATCTNDLAFLPLGFKCTCPPGFTDVRCQTAIDECVDRPEGAGPVCSGRGLCISGSGANGDRRHTCLCQPGWKGVECELQADQCRPLVPGDSVNCRNGATCVNRPTGFKCLCAAGYEGEFCERFTDECSPQPCAEGATCIDLFNDYRCVCAAGWTGRNCSEEVNECIATTSRPNPCANGATCVDAVNNVTCVCTPFYTGRFCETPYNPCDPHNDPCFNGATCMIDVTHGYVCVCLSGFEGIYCEVDVNACISGPCQNGARCEDLPGAAYRCHCQLGFNGTECQNDIDNCAINFCQNNSTCEDLVNGYKCHCGAGVYGANCSFEVNECASEPCLNGATCEDAFASFICHCSSAYTGVTCALERDECLSVPCQHGGSCRDELDGYYCLCPPGYTGVNCEVDIDDCASLPCQNGANCTDLVNGYVCTCLHGWIGLNCELNVDECLSSPCLGGATCVDGVASFECVCAEGFTGPHCEVPMDVCQMANFTQCQNGGTCVNRPGLKFTCSCQPGYTGELCEIDIDECASQPCSYHNGDPTCVDGVNGFTCMCRQGVTGNHCEKDVNECISFPCQNNGICRQWMTREGFECLCPAGFGGILCEENYNDCATASHRCGNGGVCVDGLNSYHCSCPAWVTGVYCETMLYTSTMATSSTVSLLVSSTVTAVFLVASSVAVPESTGLPVSSLSSLMQTLAPVSTVSSVVSTGSSVSSMVSTGLPVLSTVSTGSPVSSVVSTGSPVSSVGSTGSPVSSMVLTGSSVSSMVSTRYPVSSLVSTGSPVSTVSSMMSTGSTVSTVSSMVPTGSQVSTVSSIMSTLSPVSTVSAMVSAGSPVSSMLSTVSPVLSVSSLMTTLSPLSTVSSMVSTGSLASTVSSMVSTGLPVSTVSSIVSTESQVSTVSSMLSAAAPSKSTPSQMLSGQSEVSSVDATTVSFKMQTSSLDSSIVIVTRSMTVSPLKTTIIGGSTSVMTGLSSTPVADVRPTMTDVTSDFIHTQTVSSLVPQSSATPVVILTPSLTQSQIKLISSVQSVITTSPYTTEVSTKSTSMTEHISLSSVTGISPTSTKLYATDFEPTSVHTTVERRPMTESMFLDTSFTNGADMHPSTWHPSLFLSFIPDGSTGVISQKFSTPRLLESSNVISSSFSSGLVSQSATLVTSLSHGSFNNVSSLVSSTPFNPFLSTSLFYTPLLSTQQLLSPSSIVLSHTKDSFAMYSSTGTINFDSTKLPTPSLSVVSTLSPTVIQSTFSDVSSHVTMTPTMTHQPSSTAWSDRPSFSETTDKSTATSSWISDMSSLPASASVSPTTVEITSTASAVTTSAVMTTVPPGEMDCNQNPCKNGGSCVNVTEVGVLNRFRCICHLQFIGIRCEVERAISFLRYNTNSLLKFASPQVESSNTITLSFSTFKDNGVIFYAAADYESRNPSHYVYLVVENGTLKYKFSCVIQSFVLDSQLRVNTGEYFNVTVIQTSSCRAALRVSSSENSSAVSLGMPFVFSTMQLTKLSHIYLGGLTNGLVGNAANFSGCISHMTWNEMTFNLTNAVIWLNVEACTTSISTVAPPTVTTSSPADICSDVTCENGGTCRPVATPGGGDYRCDCPLHFAGVRCEEEITNYFPRFHGNSYLEHRLPRFADDDENDHELYVSFKTKSSNGTILYSDDMNENFVHLFIENGILQYTQSCGLASALYIDTLVHVNSGNLTEVTINLSASSLSKQCRVSVHTSLSASQLSTSSAALTTSHPVSPPSLTPFYLGGLPPTRRASVRMAGDVRGFVGCIRQVQVAGVERGGWQAVAGDNVDSCQVAACSYHPCSNNGTCHVVGESWFCECPRGYTGDLCERTLCYGQPCEHGGTCIHLPLEGTYVCLCPYGRHGVNCSDVSLTTVASFHGSHYGYSSYVAYPLIKGMDFELDLRLNFTLANNGSALQDGLMIFSGQSGAQPTHGADFIAVGVQRGHVVFRFDLGSGLAELRSALPINTQVATHYIELGRRRQYGWLQLDGQSSVTGKSRGNLFGLNLFSPFYVGGHESYQMKLLPDGVNFNSGFNGCIYGLQLRVGRYGRWQNLDRVESGRNVHQCERSECELNRCFNGATCEDLGASFRCHCSAGWMGLLCADQTDLCHGLNHACAPGAICTPEPGGGYHCDCPLGKAGQRCDENVTISDARFVGAHSFLAFSSPRRVRSSVTIRLRIRPTVTDGLVLYMADQAGSRAGDFLSVALHLSHVQLRYNTGMDRAMVITGSVVLISDGSRWYDVIVGRNKTVGFVEVEGERVETAAQPGMFALDIGTLLYVGGVPELSAIAAEAVENEPVTFEGCISKLEVNGLEYELNERGAVDGLNVVDCDGTSCGHNVCLHGGTCHPKTDGGGFSCLCPDLYQGERCEMSVYCDNNACANGATCIADMASESYSCDCPIGSSGALCRDELNFTAARFTANSYMYLHDSHYDDDNVTSTFISFTFTTRQSHGMVLWNGEVHSERDDYLGVGLSYGRLKLVISLGWWTRTQLMSREVVSIDQWHQVIIQREGRELILSIDNEVQTSVLDGDFDGLNTLGKFHLGGFARDKDIWDETMGHFTTPFSGCLRDLHIQRGVRIDLTTADAGVNIHSCDDTET